MRVIAKPEVYGYLEELVNVLYENGYFGFEDDAIEYVKDLVFDIEKNLHTKLKKRAPKYFERYGKGLYYAGFKKNKRTTWYVFFTKYMENEEEIYLVRYIANNHEIAHHL